MKYDLIVVGSGSVGAAAGYYGARAGLRVLMLDSGHPPHDQGSHHGETRLMRHAYGEGVKYVPLALRAQRLWDELAAAAGVELFRRTGVLYLGPRDSSFIRNVLASAETFALPVERLAGPAVTARWPPLAVPAGHVGVFEPDAGVLMCEAAVDAYVRLAARSGCTQLFGCRVTDVRRGAGGGVTVATERGEFAGAKAVVSAGTWVGRLLPELPVAPVRKTFAWHRVAGDVPPFTALTHDDFYYGIPAEGGLLKIGKHNGGRVLARPEQREAHGAGDAAELAPLLRAFLPGAGACERGAACTYAMSPDEDFIVDARGDTLVVAGLSGHGFKFAPVLGEIACQFALGQKPDIDLTPFSLSRFNKASKY